MDFVLLGGLIVFRMETLEILAWQLEVNSIVVVFLQDFFSLDILGFGLTWEFVGMVATGAEVHFIHKVVSYLSCFNNYSWLK